MRSVIIKTIKITVDSAYKSERHAYNESALYVIGNQYQNVTINVEFDYQFVSYDEDEDGNAVIISGIMVS